MKIYLSPSVDEPKATAKLEMITGEKEAQLPGPFPGRLPADQKVQ